MYVTNVPNRNSPPAVLLRESFRQQGKVKNRTIANLTSWPVPRVEALRRLLRGELDNVVHTDPRNGPEFGLLYVLKQIAEDLGIPAAVGRKRAGQLALFLVLARIAHQGSRLSAVRWAREHAVAEVLGLSEFDEDDLYASLDDLCARQQAIERKLFQRYLRRQSAPPTLFLYDVTSSYLEGEQNELGEFGHDRDGKRGKLQIVIGLLTDGVGEPLAVRVFAGNTADPTTVAEQIAILKQQFAVEELVFVGDRGMVKSKGKQALKEAGLRYISALTDPQIRKLLANGTLQMSLFSETVAEVEADGLRYLLRKNEDEAARQRHRLEDKLDKLNQKMEKRNAQVAASPRCKPEAGLRKLRDWISRYKLTGMVDARLEDRHLVLEKNAAGEQRAMLLAGCYVIVSDVPQTVLDTKAVHDGYMALENVERDFRTLKTGLLEIRPVCVRKESRTRGHVFSCMLALKVTREIERRLKEAFGTTETNPHCVTLPDALAALHGMRLLLYDIDEKTILTRLPRPGELQGQVLEALGIKLPTLAM